MTEKVIPRMNKWKSYPWYENSGIKGLGDIPDHWEIKKLKLISTVQSSNVDKKTVEGEVPVLLCNYVDVYYNDKISNEINFMKATAKPEQVRRFSLKRNDVLITKDSESPSDIAVPALVDNDLEGVICAYHLAHIRPNKLMLNGRYLSRAFVSQGIREQFWTSSNGITRFGLPKEAINNGLFLVPPLEEQNIISLFLDRETAKLDKLVDKKERLIELLKEKRQAVISETVSKGLDTSVPMKDSGFEWLGEIPEHWDLIPLKFSIQVKDGTHDTPEFVDKEQDKTVPLITSKNIKDGEIDFSDVKHITRGDHIQISKRSNVEEGDTLMPMIGTIGNPVIVQNYGDFSIKNVALFKTSNSDVSSSFVYYSLLSEFINQQFMLLNRGGVQSFVSLDVLRNLKYLRVPPNEEKGIVNYLDVKTKKISNLINRVQQQITKIKEYRQSLISAAVTGKIDVRDEISDDEIADLSEPVTNQ